MRAVPATFFFAWFAWFAVHLNSLSASAGERAGERCRSNEFASIREIRVKVFVFISSFSSLLAFVFSAFFTVKSPPSVIRVIRVSAFVLIMGSSDPLAWRGGRARHSVRAVPWHPVTRVGSRGVQGTARPTCRCATVKFNCPISAFGAKIYILKEGVRPGVFIGKHLWGLIRIPNGAWFAASHLRRSSGGLGR